MPAPGNPPPRKQIKEIDLGQVECRSTQTQSLTVIACVVLQRIPCSYECRCMSDGVFVQFVSIFKSRLRSARGRFVCIVFGYGYNGG